MSASDIVAMQDRGGVDSAFTNTRYTDYRQYLDENASLMIKVQDLTIYCMRNCSASMRASGLDKNSSAR
jgi:hypothetical protein